MMAASPTGGGELIVKKKHHLFAFCTECIHGEMRLVELKLEGIGLADYKLSLRTLR